MIENSLNEIAAEHEIHQNQLSKQSELLGLNRTSLYYKPVFISQEELQIKRIIDEIYTKQPEYG